MTTLFSIAQIAKSDVSQAGELLLGVAREIFPSLDIRGIAIHQSPVSLNSVHGQIVLREKGSTGDYEQFFFKFHVEEGDEKTIDEYYRGRLIADAGYPVVTPVHASTTPGNQFLIYPLMPYPTLFQVMDEIDRVYMQTKTYDESYTEKLLAFEDAMNQEKACISLKTLHSASAEEWAQESLHQLFYTRLRDTRSTPRFELYYRGKNVRLPGGEEIPFDHFAKLKWRINGMRYEETLGEVIEEAIKLLDPWRLVDYPAVVGHGDDHNGNKFVTPDGFVYFDPAFAGRHHYVLLSFIKTTFHDTFAHPFWLYDPESLTIHVSYALHGEEIVLEHDMVWEQKAPIRKEFLKSKIKHLWIPILQELRKEGNLEASWGNYIRKALFACPFLVYNLLDYGKYSPTMSLFALSRALELGSRGEGGFLDNHFFDLITYGE